jgi:hypothetical protein
MTPTPDYKREIQILTELVLDLYAKNAALAAATIRDRVSVGPGNITEAETKAYDSLSRLPEVQALIQHIDGATLEAARKVLKDFRG